jgi:diguanylate cyclase (GGDEF)-like protein/PAS domain S-box-containing protein
VLAAFNREDIRNGEAGAKAQAESLHRRANDLEGLAALVGSTGVEDLAQHPQLAIVAHASPLGVVDGSMRGPRVGEIAPLGDSERLSVAAYLQALQAPTGPRAGFAVISGRPMIVAAAPRTSAGWIVLGRDVADAVAMETALGGPAVAVERPGVALGSTVTESLVRTRVALPDARDDTAAILVVDHPRTLFSWAYKLVHVASVLVAVLGGVAAAAVAWLADRLANTRMAQRDAERAYAAFVEHSGEGVLIAGYRTRRVIHANRAAGHLLGVSAEALAGAPLAEVIPGPRALFDGAIGNLEPGGQVRLPPVRHRGIGGVPAELELTAHRLTWDGRDCVGILARDVTERMREAERARHVAHHDALTGLPNRALFSERLRVALDEAQSRSDVVGVAFIDLDQFKEVNDTFGHDTADRILVDVARRLQGVLRAGDTVARQGGDEFLVLLPRLRDARDARARIDRLLAALRQPFVLDGRELRVTASAGLAVYPESGTEAVELVKNADAAMYTAKDAGRDVARVFDSRMAQRAARQLSMRTRLGRALDAGEFSLAWQPQVRLDTGRIEGVEALLRWKVGNAKVPPVEFIPVAEETGLIVPIGEWVIKAAAAEAAVWQRRGLPAIRVAVNMSARQLIEPTLVDTVRRILADARLPPRQLEVEITESIAMKNPDLVRRVLGDLRRSGVHIALDDFGTGYSSLGYLRMFPIDRVKLDRSFLSDATMAPGQREMVAAIISLAHAIGLEVTAEGVESPGQYDQLALDGCDGAQGFGICPPVSGEELCLLLASKDPLGKELERRRIPLAEA